MSSISDDSLDLSGVLPEAYEIVRAASKVLIRHTHPWLIGLLIHGSAYKGDFIRGCSDIDLKLYVDDSVFSAGRQLLFDLCMAIQRDLSRIDPTPFQYIQCYAHGTTQPGQDDVGPVRWAYHMLLGSLPVGEATQEELRKAADTALRRLEPYPSYIATSLLQHGSGKLERTIRFAFTDVWPTLYQILVLQRDDAIHVWGLRKQQAIVLLSAQPNLYDAIQAFYAAVRTYYDVDMSVDNGLRVLDRAVTFLAGARSWWAEAQL